MDMVRRILRFLRDTLSPCPFLRRNTSWYGRCRRGRGRTLYALTLAVILFSSCCTRTSGSGNSDKSSSTRYHRSTVDEQELRWVSTRTLAFARFWRNHKYRNLAVYFCVATRSLPAFGPSLRLILGCPDSFYTELWSRAFDVPRNCVSRRCLRRFGRGHFVYAEFIVMTYTQVMSTEFLPARPSPNGKVAVIVEPRQPFLFEYVIRQVMSKLGKDWSLQVFVYGENVERVRNMFKLQDGSEQEHVIVSDLSHFGTFKLTQRTQSALSAHSELYHAIVGEHIFWFQLDVVVRHSVPDKMLERAFIGSEFSGCEFPYCDPTHCRSLCGGGNSGFSLRRKSKMLKIASAGKVQNNLWGVGASGEYFASDLLYDNSRTKWFEDDLLFAEKLNTLGLLRYGEDAVQQQFALGETLGDDSLKLDPIGLHRIWLVPNMDPLVIISLLSRAVSPPHMQSLFRAGPRFLQRIPSETPCPSLTPSMSRSSAL
ncbi:uncharacterized protein MICPUCDRAFT_54927 [Micromonas pusilla CCMP1545]|uniref:Predicted protein n=1 Tax=Micromonas pusilla (strain CCMP1545) TaxID=564608 RepID=C1NAI6_MICPC|nr:uncharacterized protein MICPUCDRAFT_54927 [Micromonas pusilla CCMP1545]EEH50947.1 predicted protein [Micromonas pusilla CCMP1545]|eukprot:XP_003064967.1 predicted protein [Micromonas pusilla CCMP1545]